MRDRENATLESGTYAVDRESDKVSNNQVLVLGNSDFTVADFPRFECSMRQVLRAGEALKGDLIWSEEKAEEFYEIFRIANNWRDSHAYPMRSLRHEIIARMRVLDVQGITAARLKRMRSIRKKLRTISATLNQIQDLGGCRVILTSIDEVNRLIEEMNNKQKHFFHNTSSTMRRTT